MIIKPQEGNWQFEFLYLHYNTHVERTFEHNDLFVGEIVFWKEIGFKSLEMVEIDYLIIDIKHKVLFYEFYSKSHIIKNK